MIDQINMVRRFHEAFDVPVQHYPNLPSWERRKLRADLLKEEALELYAATANDDLVETLDGIIDCLYILFGTALEFGLQDRLVAAFDEVHCSNMSKLDENGNPVKRPDGKVIKSNLFQKPNLAKLI